MPRTYKKIGKRCAWAKGDLLQAIADVNGKRFSVRAASRAYSISRTTLQEYVNEGLRKHKLVAEHEPGKLGQYPTLGSQFEQELCDYAKKMSDLYFGITRYELCRLAYELAERNGIRQTFNQDRKMAGQDWYYGFMKRNPSLSLRTAESTSLSRVTGFRRSELSRYFENLKTAFDKDKFDPTRVYNVDETGMSTVQKQRQKILSTKGKKQVGKVVSAEKGETITAVVCISASGSFVPPMLIFPRKNFNDRLLHGPPPGTVGSTSPSGWINSELYVKWLKHFIQHTGATPEHKVLLILDNHESHVSIDAWELCRANGVIVVSLPPHCSHKCQPLDVAVFGPLKSCYYRRCDEWMKSNPAKRITQYEVASLFGQAYCSVANVQKCVQGFQSTGIVPQNSDIFRDEDFAAAENLMGSNQSMAPNSLPSVNQVNGLADIDMPRLSSEVLPTSGQQVTGSLPSTSATIQTTTCRSKHVNYGNLIFM